MAAVMGVDGDKAGWVGVVLRDGEFAGAHLGATLHDLHAAAGAVDAIAVDMPIGWFDGIRAADTAVRARLPGKSSSVFNAPSAAVRDAADYSSALERSRTTTGRGLSKQSWALVPKIRAATDFAMGTDVRVVEAHPELAFAVMAGDAPVTASKYSWHGHCRRVGLLAGDGIHLPADLGSAGTAGTPDVLDAAAVAWVAARVSSGDATSHPDPPEMDAAGWPCAIWA